MIAKLRESLPQYKPEELEQLRAMLRAPHLPDFSLPPELEAQLRDWRYRLPEPEQASEQAVEQPADVLQEEKSKQTTNQKHPGGRPPISPELIQAAQEEYRRAVEGDGQRKNHEAASTHLNAWLAKSRWAEKFKTISLRSWERHVLRPVLRPSGATSSDRQNSTVI